MKLDWGYREDAENRIKAASTCSISNRTRGRSHSNEHKDATFEG